MLSAVVHLGLRGLFYAFSAALACLARLASLLQANVAADKGIGVDPDTAMPAGSRVQQLLSWDELLRADHLQSAVTKITGAAVEHRPSGRWRGHGLRQ